MGWHKLAEGSRGCQKMSGLAAAAPWFTTALNKQFALSTRDAWTTVDNTDDEAVMVMNVFLCVCVCVL